KPDSCIIRLGFLCLLSRQSVVGHLPESSLARYLSNIDGIPSPWPGRVAKQTYYLRIEVRLPTLWYENRLGSVRELHPQAKDDLSQKDRAAVLRYINLTIALTFSMVSPLVKNKLGTLNAFMNAGYLTPEEVHILENLEKRTTKHKTWVPIMWACKVIERARKEQRLTSDSHQKVLITE
ncbi:hypothetical protein SK128_019224, partial [Halocaridina rubra]